MWTSVGQRFSVPRLLLSLLLGVGCADGPAERFGRDALPVLERRCASATCHGVAPGDEWPAAPGFFVRLDAVGRIADPVEAREVARARITTRVPRASTLLRIPLPAWAGGGPHVGGALFTGPDDLALESLLRWVEAEESGGEDLELDALETLFGEEVLPVLVERCARDGCHGPRDLAFTAFPVHPVEPGAQFGDRDIRASRRVARRHLDLWGADATRSRLVRKTIGEHHAEGLVHRGGSGTFFPEAQDDPLAAPGVEAILRWARAERSALGVEDGIAPSAIVYVDGPPAPRRPYRIEAGPVGSDVFRAGWPEAGAPENLTAALHPEGPVEIRDLALSHDALRVAFAMRRTDEEHFAIWELELASAEANRRSPSGAGSFVQPAYASDGRIVAAWDGHGELGVDGPGVAPELVALGSAEGSAQALERLTYTPAPEVYPAMLATGKTRGELVFGTRRVGSRGDEGVLFRVPLCHDPAFHGEPEYHVQHGSSLAPAAPLVARDLPDGRQLMIVLATSREVDDRGALMVLDRSLGPDLASDEELSLGGYRRPISVLDLESRFRDPAPLPDGRFIVSADTAGSPGEDALFVMRIEDTPDGAVLAERTPWLERPGRSLRSALPVFTRPPEDDGHETLTDSSAPDGFLALRDVAVLEALFGRVEPSGARVLRDDIVGLRLLEATGALASEVTRHADGGTSAGLSARIPARVLAEVPLPADRSAYLRIPPRTPILLQLLDRSGMEVGRGLDRWYYAEGGEVVPGGTNLATYGHDCSGCHGSASGHPSEAASSVPDAISAASVTLSTHVARDRRRPLPPLALPDAGEAVDFVGTIRPIIDMRCTGGCHSAADPVSFEVGPGAGRFPAAYEALAGRVDLVTLRARRSALVERLAGRELDAPSAATGVCPPDGSDPELVRVFARWIEAGALFDIEATEATSAP